MEVNYLGRNLLFRHIVWRARQRLLIPIHSAAVGDGEHYWLIRHEITMVFVDEKGNAIMTAFGPVYR